MIVNNIDTGWEVIFQRAHALLAAELAARWQIETRPARWWETLVAISQHDSGWQEWEEVGRLTDVGTPLNFTQRDLSSALGRARHTIAQGWHHSRWVGLLISCHIAKLYEGRRGELAEMDEFLDEQAAQRKIWQAELGATEEEIAAAYALLWWSDVLSLILCQKHLPLDGRAIEIGQGPDGVSYTVRQREDGALMVTPWPYQEKRFMVSVEAYCLNQVTFADDDALEAALQTAPVKVYTWEVVE
jgi:hypothetical protein